MRAEIDCWRKAVNLAALNPLPGVSAVTAAMGGVPRLSPRFPHGLEGKTPCRWPLLQDAGVATIGAVLRVDGEGYLRLLMPIP